MTISLPDVVNDDDNENDNDDDNYHMEGLLTVDQ